MSSASEPAGSPLIRYLSWGRMQVEGCADAKDFKLWPGGGRAWDWTETGLSHDPGIQVDDVRELVEHGARVVVLSQGMMEALKCQPETLAWLEQQDVRVEVLETRAAAQRYNDLAREGEAVGGLFHSTC